MVQALRQGSGGLANCQENSEQHPRLGSGSSLAYGQNQENCGQVQDNEHCFVKKEISNVLAFTVLTMGSRGIKPGPSRIQALIKFPAPETSVA